MKNLALILAIVLATTMLPAQNNEQKAVNVDTLARFLVKAKLEGYASGDQTRIHKLDDGGLGAAYASGQFSYRDRWYGERRFAGEEIVQYQGRPVWSLNFFGASPQTIQLPSGFSSFHKSALRRVPDAAPFRGPAFYQEGEFVYVNDVTGTIREFSGVERVLFHGQEIFRLVYHGGLVE